MSLKELLAFTGTWDEHAGLSCERTILAMEGRGPTEDTKHWEEQKSLGVLLRRAERENKTGAL